MPGKFTTVLVLRDLFRDIDYCNEISAPTILCLQQDVLYMVALAMKSVEIQPVSVICLLMQVDTKDILGDNLSLLPL